MTQIYKYNILVPQSGICSVDHQEGTGDYPHYKLLHHITQNGIHFKNVGHSDYVKKEFLVPDNPVVDVSYMTL